jgi:two-component system chemotaxis response regulator CheB
MNRTRVLVIDDSAMMRELLADILARDPEIEVVGTAPDPILAWQRIKALRPDVITLDVEMPRMDGLTFLQNLMTHRPMPVVMISSLTERGGEICLRALELGAIDFVTKPKLDVRDGTVEQAEAIIAKVKTASRARIHTRTARGDQPRVKAPLPAGGASANVIGTHQVLAIGASTGGTEALLTMLSALPPDAPAVVVVQHMPEKFTSSFAARLDKYCEIRVKEAERGDRLLPGHALLVPGNHHGRVVRSGFSYRLELSQEGPVSGHRPSVNVLFDSVAANVGRNAVGAILTGMGDDGARGLRAMHEAGAWTLAQDENTCVVFGMPAVAIKLGAVDEVLPLDRLAAAALRAAGRHDKSA